MVSLAAGASLQNIADVLRSAAIVGPGLWAQGEHVTTDPQRSVQPPLSQDVVDLFRTLDARKVPYLLVGGVAMLRYVEGRNTDDVDLLLSVGSLASLPEIVVKDQNRDFARGMFRSVRVDLLLSANPVFGHVLERHATNFTLQELSIPCATVEGLVLLKLYAIPSLYRQGDIQRALLYESDVAMLMQRHAPSVGALLEFLRPHLDAGQFAELSGIVKEIEQRVARTKRTS